MAAKKKKGGLKKRATAGGHGRARIASAGANRSNGSNGANSHATQGAFALNAHGRRQVPCLSCGICCTYVAAEVEGPVGIRSATEILWYLYHENVSVYRDTDDEWLLQFETRCQHLLPDNKCNIYAQRPHICRTFDERDCEVNVADEGQIFSTPGEFLAYLQEHKRAIYRKLEGRFLPPEESLDGKPMNPRKLSPFEPRFRRLRVLGEVRH